MNPNPQVLAAASSDAYKNRSPSDVDDRAKLTNLSGHEYTIFGYKDDPVTGFHATAYREVAPPHNIIIAYRGTDPDFKHHGLTGAQDLLVDATMVRDRVNLQEADARAFTQAMIDKAARHGIGKDQISVAGHSLGGTLAEIESWRFGLGGATFNAYGAVGLGYGIPEGGGTLLDYVMAGDPVSAGSLHHGKVLPLASDEDVLALQAGRYLGLEPGMPPRNPFLAMRFSDHTNTHFSPAPGSHVPSVLQPGMIEKYAQNYADHKAAFDAYRTDVRRERGELATALRDAKRDDADVVLPADIQRQLDEYLAVNADPAIRQAIEGNAWVRGTEHRLQQGAGMVDAAGVFVQHQDERAAALAREAGAQMAVVNPVAPLAGLAMGEAAHLHGQATRATSRAFADGVHAMAHAIKQDAHAVAGMAEAAIHSPALHNEVTSGVNHLVDAYRSVETAARAMEATYDEVRNAVSRGIEATERSARDAYASISHFGTHGAGRERPDRVLAPGAAASQGFADANHPRHLMYAHFQKLLPHGTSPERLHQITAACHQAGIDGPDDLAAIHGVESSLVFTPGSMFARTAVVDLGRPAPSVQQTLQQLRQYNEQQAQLQPQLAAPVEAHVQPGPVR
jgi:hypothetical protein